MGEHRSPRGFTLLEVLVVGVIVAVVGAMMISVVSKMNRAARGASCTSNLNQILQALVAYNMDNSGYYPYGFYWANSDPVTWEQVGPSTDSVTWVSSLTPYLGGSPPTFPPVLQCPEAQQFAEHPVSYVMNFIVAISPLYELNVGNLPNAQVKPSKTFRMLEGGTALIWDTAVQEDWQDFHGFLTGADVDLQRFWDGANSPQLRYFSPSDPFGQIPPGIFGNNRMVLFGATFKNVDPPIDSHYPYQGNLRFRHGTNNLCNVGFSDGSVRQFTATIRPDLTVAQHDALRRYFMTHWPPGLIPNPAFPSGEEPHPPVRDPGR